MEQYIYKDEYRYPIETMLNVTDDCNLQCRYCFVEQQPHYMTLDTAKAVADFLYNNRQKRKELGYKCYKTSRIYFFGGEPMLCYKSIIIPLVEYCKEKYPNIFTFGMTTNGTLLNHDVIDFLYENKFDLLLSIDGDKETQDYNRPCRDCHLSSFDLLEKNIPYLLEKFPNIVFRSTIYGPTVNHLYENYLYAEKMGFKWHMGIEDARHPWTNEQIETLKQEMAKIYQHMIKHIINHEPIMINKRITDWLSYTINLYSDKDYYNIKNWNNVVRCGMGTPIGAIGWDGSIYGCQEQVSKKEKSLFYIGNIFNGGIDIEKHNNLLKFYYENTISIKLDQDKCKDCALRPLCQVGVLNCPSTTLDICNDMKTEIDINCQMKKIYYNNSLLLMKILFSLDDDYAKKQIIELLKK